MNTRKNYIRGLTQAALVLALIFTTVTPALAQGGQLNVSLSPNYGTVTLRAGFTPDPHRTSIQSGGSVDVSYLNRPNCAGYATSGPDLRVRWSGNSDHLRIFFVGDGDTTLIINDPSGRWYCSDDTYSTRHPSFRFDDPEAGQYDIWVGSFSRNEQIRGTLYMTEQSYSPTNLPGTGQGSGVGSGSSNGSGSSGGDSGSNNGNTGNYRVTLSITNLEARNLEEDCCFWSSDDDEIVMTYSLIETRNNAATGDVMMDAWSHGNVHKGDYGPFDPISLDVARGNGVVFAFLLKETEDYSRASSYANRISRYAGYVQTGAEVGAYVDPSGVSAGVATAAEIVKWTAKGFGYATSVVSWLDDDDTLANWKLVLTSGNISGILSNGSYTDTVQFRGSNNGDRFDYRITFTITVQQVP